MSHPLVLARKWRPKAFSEIVGQEPVRQALSQGLEHGRVHHAYLFTGTRGVGKTTFARLVAKCFNCAQGIGPNPCGQCVSCVAIQEGRSVDVIEVDAASRTRIEDTQALLDNIPYAPVQSRFKVYIIDEVHQLSGHSFNALLKTLEEPPSHVIFLLATTDPQKLPATVLSRCLKLHLQPIAVPVIAAQLANILTAEGISFEHSALLLLAQAADGSMRDALSLSEQAIAYAVDGITSAVVETMLGVVS
ncbi:MAG: DNA polymerase III subunit gamma/tau, partial [Pseudomonadota bacterium]